MPSATPSQAALKAAACTDAKGDGDGADLRKVTLRKVDQEIVAVFTTAKPVPAKGTVLWALTAASADGEDVIQLGAKYLNGKQVAHYAFRTAQAKQENFAGIVAVSGAKMTTRFPASVVGDLGNGAKWHAALNVAGKDLDECPNQPGGLNPKTLKFPATWF